MDERYPIGRAEVVERLTGERRAELIRQIEEAPAALRAALTGLSDEQLDTPYREGGWTVRQLAHHVPDSHLNAYTRFRLALTENEPTIKPYSEKAWSELPDARTEPVEPSLRLLEALHQRWVPLLRAMTPEEWERGFVHPEHGRRMSLDQTLQIYAWHGRHHTAHVTRLRERQGW
ncbi:MAG TPA: bacillithiol transferase BstA [Longimicrobiales bacterium]